MFLVCPHCNKEFETETYGTRLLELLKKEGFYDIVKDRPNIKLKRTFFDRLLGRKKDE